LCACVRVWCVRVSALCKWQVHAVNRWKHCDRSAGMAKNREGKVDDVAVVWT